VAEFSSIPPVVESPSYQPPGDLRTTLLIARRAALESLRDRTTLVSSVFFSLAIPVIFALIASQSPSGILVVFLLSVGLLPSTAAVGVASGQFAGEKEQGNLAPLLASPASNRAIFGGKVLGAVLPALLYSAIGIAAYLAALAIFASNKLQQLPVALSLAMVALVPTVAIFAAAVASLVSSRVRTFQAAQSVSGFLLVPLFIPIYALAVTLQNWSSIAVLAGVVALVDIGLVYISAAVWRREEVLARR
jgi:ABC-type Na+ efflux pump permease subunit